MNSACVPPAAGETEFPQFSGGTVIVMDRLIDGIGVDLADAIAVDHCRDMGQQLGQLRLMVGAHAFVRGTPLGAGPHDSDGTVSRLGQARAHRPPARVTRADLRCLLSFIACKARTRDLPHLCQRFATTYGPGVTTIPGLNVLTVMPLR